GKSVDRRPPIQTAIFPCFCTSSTRAVAAVGSAESAPPVTSTKRPATDSMCHPVAGTQAGASTRAATTPSRRTLDKPPRIISHSSLHLVIYLNIYSAVNARRVGGKWGLLARALEMLIGPQTIQEL